MYEGQPNKPKHVKCQDKTFPDCYHKKLLCPDNCLRDCDVDCASCQPVCKALPPPPPPMKVKCKDKKFGACCKREDLYCPATCPTSCEVDCQSCQPKCVPPKGKEVQCTDSKHFPTCYRKKLYCPSTCPEDCDVDCESCQPICKPLQVRCTDPFYKKSCKKSLYCPFDCPTTCTVNCGNCTAVCPQLTPTPTPPPVVTPSPPSPPVVTPSPASPPASPPVVTPSPASPPSPPMVTPSPASPPSPPTVTPSPPSPPVVTPSPASPPASPPVVTPSPASPPSPPVVTPSPASPSPPVVTPSPAATPPSPPMVTPSPASPPTSAPPSPPTQSPPPDSSEVASGRRVRCRNKNYTTCYLQEHRCPAACPHTCEVDCVTCSPVCNCNMPGAVCQDPRFIGADGLTFYFHGKKDNEFCIVSDNNLHINAHFIGRRNMNMGRDFTWVQSLGILFDNHQILVGAKKTAIWDNGIDRLHLSYDGLPVVLTEGEGATWTSEGTTIKRTRDTNSVVIEVEGNFQIKATVVPITKDDSKIHKYGVTDEDCFAHLDLGFKFYLLSGDVSGVLGQTYASNYVSRVKMGIDMPVLGGQKEFASSGLFSTDCSVARFMGTHNTSTVANNFEYANLKCESGIDGRGVVCKR